MLTRASPPHLLVINGRYYAFSSHHRQAPVVVAGVELAYELMHGDFYRYGQAFDGFEDLEQAVTFCAHGDGVHTVNIRWG